ncbi:hypothetical protein ACSFA8_22980 [Variovorax sp. RT4R15]|uniref:hypothetical protein n=1 Tax=Variovorax sp. RT4R15 TaxID=3443737 RepID=UPI003F44A8B4
MKRFFILLAACLVVSISSAQQRPTFVFVKIAEPIMPLERESKYEDPLDEALKKARLGEVTGGGSSLSKEKKIEWVGLDVELTDVPRGIPLLRKKLIELGAPKGSTMEYELDGAKRSVLIHTGQ